MPGHSRAPGNAQSGPMARLSDRHPRTAEGPWFVDTRCINCAASRHVAPGLLVEIDDSCVFERQPVTVDEIVAAWRAVEICPTRSIGAPAGLRPPIDVYPFAVEAGVYLCGHNARSSFGAHSWFVPRVGGNLLVDSPRYTRRLVDAFDAAGGIAAILLTHRDDVADAEQWAQRFGSAVYIHADDADAAPYATHVIDAAGPVDPFDGVTMIPVPGHTRGSVVYLVQQRWLFTGDSLAWDIARNHLIAFRDACWYSWTEQKQSLSRLIGHPFEQVFAGHGSWSPPLTVTRMRDELEALVTRM
jgi:glyoxylase-like metal-dependent hydrolase (beta-lactamase superfamily II)/ferredoxin